MGISGSSLLDENKSSFIRGEAEAELQRFSPFYRKQFCVSRFCQAQNDMEQQQEQTTQLLRQRAPPAGGEVLYEDAVLYFDESRKWRERYIVVRANYSLECHESLESFLKGAPPHHRLLPTGGAVLTTEERYMQLVDRCFPDDSSVTEDFAPPLSSMPGQFPVYLRLPYRRDSYFCFKQQLRQEAFLSALWDCVRHQNQDFLKKNSCEVKSFLKAVQFYRESQGRYKTWDMMIGSDVRVLSNFVMERLLPTLEKDLLPKLKAKKSEKKRVWFAMVEAAYILVQEVLLEGLSSLKDELRTSLRQKEVLIHSDMDQIQRSRDQVQERVRGSVLSSAELVVSEKVQPYLGSILEELMDPISHGFSQGRDLCATSMEKVSQDILQGTDNEMLKKELFSMSRPRLMDCYTSIASLENKLQLFRDRFGFTNVSGIIHSAQIDLQQLMENAAHTFETLLYKVLEEHQENAAIADAVINKARLRVLKQFNYDSSSTRKRIFEDALVQITLPFVKEQLQEPRPQLQDAADNVFLDHCDFIQIENIYEDVLLNILHKEVSKVLKDELRLQKYDLMSDSRDLLSRSSLSSTGSAPPSPALTPASTVLSPASPALSPTSPALSLASSPCTANHSSSPVTTLHTPTMNQEVQLDADPAATGTGQQEARVEVEEICDISEETGSEFQVKTERKEEKKMVESAEKISEDQVLKENHTREKVEEAEVQEDICDNNNKKMESEIVKMEEAPEETGNWKET
ncbi:protein Niban 1-like, partial [Eucyclogobius newberryi]|uniref:protein Niban 1-like n=1 Tax=Eucyclogobius newberryi TaxID=166745 RepID=UPI003B5CD513